MGLPNTSDESKCEPQNRFLGAHGDGSSSASSTETPADASARQSLAARREGNLATQTRSSIRPPTTADLRLSAEAEDGDA